MKRNNQYWDILTDLLSGQKKTSDESSGLYVYISIHFYTRVVF